MPSAKALSPDDLATAMEESRPRGIVFLLGAGASVEAGLPTSAEMLKKLRNGIRGDRGEVLSQILELRPCSNIEDLLLTLHGLATPQDEFIYRFAASWKLPLGNAAFRKAVTALRRTVTKRLYGWLKPSKEISYLARLYDYSSDKALSEHERFVKVFTLNFDLAVEEACRQKRIPCWSGFEGGIGRFNARLFEKPGVHLYKLHGSLNWGVIKGRRGAAPLTEISAVALSDFEYRYPFSYLKERWVQRLAPGAGYYLDSWGRLRGMMFGVNDKLVAYDPYLYLQNEFNKQLSKASVVVVLGYSWSDSYINLRIEMERNRAIPLWVIDVTRDAERAVKEAEQGRRPTNMIIGGGVKAALNGGRVQLCLVGVDEPVDGGLIGAIRRSSETHHIHFLGDLLKESYWGPTLWVHTS